VAETTVKSLLCCGFRRTGKATGQVYQCWWKICREINVFFFFSRFEYHMFFVVYPCMTYLLTFPRIRSDAKSSGEKFKMLEKYCESPPIIFRRCKRYTACN
jgi:hypothetical protein